MGEDKGATLVAVSSLFIAVCTVAVGLRFAARASRKMKFDLDDWMSAVTLVSLYPRTTLERWLQLDLG